MHRFQVLPHAVRHLVCWDLQQLLHAVLHRLQGHTADMLVEHNHSWQECSSHAAQLIENGLQQRRSGQSTTTEGQGLHFFFYIHYLFSNLC